MTTQTNIDGRYLLFPDGCGWEYVRIRDGRVVSTTEQSNLGTHEAAQDQLAWLADVDMESLTPLTDPSACRAILDASGHAASDLESVMVCPVARPA